MRKTILMLIFCLLAMSLISGWSFNVRIQESEKLTNVITVNASVQSPTENKWKEAYKKFLSDFQGDSKYTNSQFSWKDLDDNGVPELIIEQVNDDGGIVIVYSYDGNIYKIGDYQNNKIGVSGLRFSNKPEFSGLFTLWWGGGVEHYGYLTVKERKLIYEELWYMDRLHFNEPSQFEVSSNKKLIDESINIESAEDSFLKMYFINEDGIAEITK